MYLTQTLAKLEEVATDASKLIPQRTRGVGILMGHV